MATAPEVWGGTVAISRSGTWRRLRGVFGVSPVVAVLIALLLVFLVPPTVYLIQASVYTTKPNGAFDQFTLRYYADLFGNPRFLQNLINSCVYAVGSAAVALTLGTLQAWIVERTNTPLRQYVFLISIISLGIPSVLYTVSFLLLLGKAGPANQILMSLFDSTTPVLNVYSMWGMVVIEGIDFVPLTFLMLSAVFHSNDASFEEASMMSGAGIATTFRRITLRLATPGLMALVILIFVRAFESFETPALVGRPGRINILTTDIFESLRNAIPPNYGQAGAFSMVLMLIVVGLLIWYNRLSRSAEKYQTITGKGFRPRVMDLGKWRYLTAALLVLMFIVIIGLPVGIVIYASLLPYYEGITAKSFGLLTFANYIQVFESSSFKGAISNTLIMGAATASLVCPLTALCAWLAARRYRGAWILDQLATMPLIFPAIVMGVAFLYVFLHMPFGLYGSLLSVILASMVRYLPYGMRSSYAGVLQLHRELEEASAISGARQATTFIRIVLPLIAPSLITCWLFVFLLSVKAVAAQILLVGPKSQIIAVTLFDLWQNGQVTELAATGVTWMSLMTVVSTIFYVIARRYGLSVR
ncbi:MAG TPA: iron ABC transporter permease [Alphaproteobacteria bacterium]|jgi:iron(III) transport system permease protein